ncbi:MAG: ImmA/IrrE family metallo-endopeptidase [Methanotrichaceae archaeon]|nr:ImmA/IrrE family metallo-endopeptidase [Methanotrichaceae archaeon]
MTRISISGPVICWALERSARRASIERRFPKLPEWQSGKSQPTLRQLEAFAKATSTPLGYLFLPEPPEERLSFPHFRTLGNDRPSGPSPDLLETVQMMERRQVWMREHLIEDGHEPLGFVGSADPAVEPERLAVKMRQTLGLAEGWAAENRTWTDALLQLRDRMEGAGVLVVTNGVVGNNTHRRLDPAEFRGFVLVDDYAPLVFVNGRDGKAAQMFTLAHELAHIWLGRSAAFDLLELRPADDIAELACNRAAAEFLVPKDQLLELWPTVKEEQDRYQAMARHFKVSELVCVRRAVDLGLITRGEFLNFYREYQKVERASKDQGQRGGNFYASQNNRIGRRFAEVVVGAAREGRLLYRDAYRLTGLYGESFERYARSLAVGGGP